MNTKEMRVRLINKMIGESVADWIFHSTHGHSEDAESSRIRWATLEALLHREISL